MENVKKIIKNKKTKWGLLLPPRLFLFGKERDKIVSLYITDRILYLVCHFEFYFFYTGFVFRKHESLFKSIFKIQK